MAVLLLNDYPVIDCEIKMARVGVWSAQAVVDSREDISNIGIFSSDNTDFKLIGRIERHGLYLDTVKVHIIGGIGDLDKEIVPRQYRGYTLKNVLTDILQDCGCVLSKTSDPALLGKFVTNWVRLGGSGKEALNILLDYFGATAWRFLPDGSFYCAITESYPPAPQVDFQVPDHDYSFNASLTLSEGLNFLPGQLFTFPGDVEKGSGPATRKISSITHKVNSSVVSSYLVFED